MRCYCPPGCRGFHEDIDELIETRERVFRQKSAFFLWMFLWNVSVWNRRYDGLVGTV